MRGVLNRWFFSTFINMFIFVSNAELIERRNSCLLFTSNASIRTCIIHQNEHDVRISASTSNGSNLMSICLCLYSCLRQARFHSEIRSLVSALILVSLLESTHYESVRLERVCVRIYYAMFCS